MTNLDQSVDVQKFQEVSSTEEASKSTKWIEVELTAIFVDTWNDVRWVRGLFGKGFGGGDGFDLMWRTQVSKPYPREPAFEWSVCLARRGRWCCRWLCTGCPPPGGGSNEVQDDQDVQLQTFLLRTRFPPVNLKIRFDVFWTWANILQTRHFIKS